MFPVPLFFELSRERTALENEVRALRDQLAAVTAERDEALEARAHDMARQSSVIAFLRKRRGRLVIERDEAIRERDEIEAAILALISSPPKEKTNDEA
jgi:hypothetical protein